MALKHGLLKDQLRPSVHTPQTLGAVKASKAPGSLSDDLNQSPSGLSPVSAPYTKFQHDARKSGKTFKGKPGAN